MTTAAQIERFLDALEDTDLERREIISTRARKIFLEKRQISSKDIDKIFKGFVWEKHLFGYAVDNKILDEETSTIRSWLNHLLNDPSVS